MKTIKREELYEMVWSEPTVKVAKTLGVSDVAVAKLCKKLAVPKPPLGYWAKKAAGKHVRQTPLPPLPKNAPEKATLSVRPENQHQAESSVDIDELKRFAAGFSASGVQFDPRRSPWSIKAVGDAERRARAVAGVIDQALRAQGATVVCKGDAINYQLLEQRFSFKIDEQEETIVVGHEKPEQMTAFKRAWQSEAKPKGFRNTRKEPTGKLSLVFLGFYARQHSWSDTARSSLEDRVPSIIVGVIRAVHDAKARDDQRRIEAHAEFERRKPRALQKLREEHLAFVLEKWRSAYELRRFIEEVERNVADRANKDAELNDWVTWLRAYADKIDPITSNRFYMQFSDTHIADEINIASRMFKPIRPWEADYDTRINWQKKIKED